MTVVLSPVPIAVKQKEGPHCWAAAMTCWLALNLDRPQLNQQQLIERYGNPENGGSISFRDLKWLDLARDMRLDRSKIQHLKAFDEVENPTDRAKQKRAQELGFKFGVEALLRRYGYLLMVFNHTRSQLFGFVSHMVVVFGTTIVDGELNLEVMDPTKGGIRVLPIFELIGNPAVFQFTLERLSKQRKPLPKITEFSEET